jgi:hypothetical protein
MDLCDFVAYISHLENISSLSYSDLVNTDPFFQVISNKTIQNKTKPKTLYYCHNGFHWRSLYILESHHAHDSRYKFNEVLILT